MGQFINITGQRFSYLTVIKQVGHSKSGHIIWECRCDCGKSYQSTSSSFKSFKVKSCGCMKSKLSKEYCFTHGESTKIKEYSAWSQMKARVSNKNYKYYYRYGERGITVCDKWINSYEAFLEDVGRAPSPNHSLDRIDNDGNYEPGNVRWATDLQQSRNTNARATNKLGIKGVRQNKNGRYISFIKYKGKNIFLGTYDDIKIASHARKEAELLLWFDNK